MIHLYINGMFLQEVEPDFAQAQVKSEAWYRCEGPQPLPKVFDGQDVVIYRRKRRTA